MTETEAIAIIGAGPYGLSISAHLSARGVPHRIFGRSMDFWAQHMPLGMQLKSEGFASNLYDPGRSLTFGDYCREQHIAYADIGVAPHVEDFVAYGKAFQQHFVRHLDERDVTWLESDSKGFRLNFASGSDYLVKEVVLAVGVAHLAYLPAALRGLSPDVVTHSSAHRELTRFAGQKVAVIGAGSSASDLVGLLHEAGAEAHLIARGNSVPFHEKMVLPRPLLDRLRFPMNRLGPGWRSLLCDRFPDLFRLLPRSRRQRIVKSFLGPVGGYFMRDRVIGHVPLHLGWTIAGAIPNGSGVRLNLVAGGGEERTLEADHVICATGYRADMSRLPFLSAPIQSLISQVDGAPTLSSAFETSLPGLYCVGVLAAPTFGPIMRFACGADFTSTRLAHHLTARFRRVARQGSMSVRPNANRLAPRDL